MTTAHFGADVFSRAVDWANYLQIDPERAFERLADILSSEHFGIEYCSVPDQCNGPPDKSMRYLNTGDSYSETIAFDEYENQIMVTTWGNWREESEQDYELENDVVRCYYCGKYTEFHWDSGADLHDCKCECGHSVTG